MAEMMALAVQDFLMDTIGEPCDRRSMHGSPMEPRVWWLGGAPSYWQLGVFHEDILQHCRRCSPGRSGCRDHLGRRRIHNCSCHCHRGFSPHCSSHSSWPVYPIFVAPVCLGELCVPCTRVRPVHVHFGLSPRIVVSALPTRHMKLPVRRASSRALSNRG